MEGWHGTRFLLGSLGLWVVRVSERSVKEKLSFKLSSPPMKLRLGFGVEGLGFRVEGE